MQFLLTPHRRHAFACFGHPPHGAGCRLGLRAPALYKDADWNEPKHDLHRLQELVQYRARRPMAADANRALRACVNARSLTYRAIADADHALSDTRSRNAYGSILVHWLEEALYAHASTLARLTP